VIKIISINSEEIDISDQFVLLEDETFIALEFTFNWFSHADSCKDCSSLLKSMQDCTGTWYLFANGRFRLIDFLFGDKEDWSTGHASYSIRSSNFAENYYYNDFLEKTMLRFKLLPCDPNKLSKELIGAKNVENYKRCGYLKRAINFN
jgi:hypothetical protein